MDLATLRISLNDTNVYRIVELPHEVSLNALHRVVQFAFGWEDMHLHSFTSPAMKGVEWTNYISEPERQRDDSTEFLHVLAPKVGDRLTYVYDFGDWWEQLYDATGLPGTGSDDLDLEAVAGFARRIGSSSPENALRARGLITRSGQVTVAGMLLFGKNPQELLPNSEVRVLKYLEDERLPGARQQLAADQRFTGTLPAQISKAADFIRSQIPTVKRLGTDGLFGFDTRIPDDAWLEGLVNAVIHRSYSMVGDNIRVEIYPSRINISSPGRFPGLADPREPESISRFARNPHIARVMTDLGIGQELGEGIRRIFAEIRRVGFLDPEYRQTNGSDILTLRAVQRIESAELVGMPNNSNEIFAILQTEPKGLGTGEIAERIGLSKPVVRKSLASLSDAGLVANGTAIRHETPELGGWPSHH
ncbi:IS1096 element passenger TnpR family protein [Corynebacterium hindlerae]|uniref:IS1096 element passenger TnpR family protein n=1 Tax=Corynebacterium hindlerae TaxID=699041 RepID=UPI0031B6B577